MSGQYEHSRNRLSLPLILSVSQSPCTGWPSPLNTVIMLTLTVRLSTWPETWPLIPLLRSLGPQRVPGGLTVCNAGTSPGTFQIRTNVYTPSPSANCPLLKPESQSWLSRSVFSFLFKLWSVTTCAKVQRVTWQLTTSSQDTGSPGQWQQGTTGPLGIERWAHLGTGIKGVCHQA